MAHVAGNVSSVRLSDYVILLSVGIALLVFVLLVWADSQTTLLMLFLIGLFYPLAATYTIVTAFLLLRAIRTRDQILSAAGGLLVFYLMMWGWVLTIDTIFDHAEFRTSYLVFFSLVTSVACIASAVTGLTRMGGNLRDPTKLDRHNR